MKTANLKTPVPALLFNGSTLYLFPRPGLRLPLARIMLEASRLTRAVRNNGLDNGHHLHGKVPYR